MRFARCLLALLFVALVAAAGCAPSIHQQLIMDTQAYTQCDHVQVACSDPNCSNVAGGPWQAVACGRNYRCERVNGQVSCVPEGS